MNVGLEIKHPKLSATAIEAKSPSADSASTVGDLKQDKIPKPVLQNEIRVWLTATKIQ